MIKNVGTDADRFAPWSQQSLFLVWGPPSHGPRSQVFAQQLGIRDCYFLHCTKRRGLWAAPWKYTYQALHTLPLLFRRRPHVVFVQSPPSFAALFVYIYCALTRSCFVIDAHSDAFQRACWTWPRWLYTFLARQAVTTIVTNEHFQQQLQQRGAHGFILRDIPTTFPTGAPYPLEGKFNLAVVNTFAMDEPLPEILEAAKSCPDVHFYVTGSTKRASSGLLASAPENVHFTDYLPRDSYYGLLNSSQAVLCLTTRNHTMQRGACEALSLGKPIITSDWPLLRTYFHQGTVHTPNSAAGICRAVTAMQRNHRMYRTGIHLLQSEQQEQWREQLHALADRIERSMQEKGVAR